MAITDWISLALICMLGAFSPGPSLAVVFAITRINGRSSGLMAALGHGLGFFLYALAAATSLSYLITNHADIFFIFQIMGSIILLWLGAKLIKASFSKSQQNNPSQENHAPHHHSKGLAGGFASGFAIAAFNPKTGAFFASLFSQFLDQGQNLNIHIGMATLAGFIDASAYVIYVMAFTTTLIAQTLDRYQHIFERTLGIILMVLGTSLIVSYII